MASRVATLLADAPLKEGWEEVADEHDGTVYVAQPWLGIPIPSSLYPIHQFSLSHLCNNQPTRVTRRDPPKWPMHA